MRVAIKRNKFIKEHDFRVVFFLFVCYIVFIELQRCCNMFKVECFNTIGTSVYEVGEVNGLFNTYEDAKKECRQIQSCYGYKHLNFRIINLETGLIEGEI